MATHPQLAGIRSPYAAPVEERSPGSGCPAAFPCPWPGSSRRSAPAEERWPGSGRLAAVPRPSERGQPQSGRPGASPHPSKGVAQI